MRQFEKFWSEPMWTVLRQSLRAHGEGKFKTALKC